MVDIILVMVPIAESTTSSANDQIDESRAEPHGASLSEETKVYTRMIARPVRAPECSVSWGLLPSPSPAVEDDPIYQTLNNLTVVPPPPVGSAPSPRVKVRPVEKRMAAAVWSVSMKAGLLVTLSYLGPEMPDFVRRHARSAANVHLTVMTVVGPLWALVIISLLEGRKLKDADVGVLCAVSLALSLGGLIYIIVCSLRGITEARLCHLYEPHCMKMLRAPEENPDADAPDTMEV